MLKIIFAVFFIAPALAGCSTDEELAQRSCARFTNDAANQQCQAYEMARITAEWDAVGMAMAARPARMTCMNIGGIISCN